MNPLNPILYDALVARFDHVLVANAATSATGPIGAAAAV
jgi:hypothetical protein